MTILSIQSRVVAGHVGNAAAVFILQRLGRRVWPVDTVTFSNHPGHGGFRGRVTPVEEIDALIQGLAERGWLGEVRAVMSGYLGDAGQGAAVLRAVQRVKEANPDAVWSLDPVMGDRPAEAQGRIYVKPGIPEFFRSAVAGADLATPNAFELETLTGAPVHDIAQAVAAARRLGPKLVVVKSVRGRAGVLTTLAVIGDAAWAVETPELDVPSFGAGDSFAALFLGRWVITHNPAAALEAAVSSIHAILAAAGKTARELALIAAQDQIVDPQPRYAVTRIA